MRRNNGRQENYEIYSADQVEGVVKALGIEIISNARDEFLCYCPFHYNRDTPAFSISTETGVYCCFNPSCQAAGSLETLVCKLRVIEKFAAKRFIAKFKNDSISYEARMARAMEKPPEFEEFQPTGLVERMFEDFWQNEQAKAYMAGRHFNEDTLRDFNIGYSNNLNMISVPFYDPDGMHIGFIGRSIEGKSFHNSIGLPKSRTLFNLHRAKNHESVIVVEASFDAMRVHQAGYPNVVGLIGGHLSKEQAYLLNRYFTSIIIMTDNDEAKKEFNCKKCYKAGYDKCLGHSPGRALGHDIANTLSNKRILWATLGDGLVYPSEPLEGYRKNAAKDPGEMTDHEIKSVTKAAVSNFEYQSWGHDLGCLIR